MPVDHHAAIDLHAGSRRQIDARAQADGRNHYVARNDLAVGQVRFQAVGDFLQAGQYRAEVEFRTEAFQPGLHRRRSGRVQQHRHDLFTGCNQLHFVAAKYQVVGKLTADQASAEQ
ncbi:hypothetical protein D3C81_1584610 [compost metagenome]